MFEPLCAALDAAGIACTRNELLADHCTFRIGGPADIFIKPCDEIQLCRAVAFCKEQGARYYLLGNGSNILFEDAGFRGAVLDLTAMKTGIGMKENIPGEESGVVYCSVTVGAGMKLFDSLQFCTEPQLHRFRVCLWHSRHGGRCDLYECRRLRRRDERCPDVRGVFGCGRRYRRSASR